MSWQEILGHEQQKEWFRRAIDRNRLASTFLFVGTDGIGKRTFARKLAQSLLCRGNGSNANSTVTDCHRFDPCGVCEDCVQVRASTHPDLLQLSKPEEKSVIPVELLIGPREHRMREGLCHDIRLRPFRGGRKIAIIDDADSLDEEGANCLLKTLEEPPPDSVLILISGSEQRQLPTIRSRCQVVRFRPLNSQQVAEILVKNQLIEDLNEASVLADSSSGSVSLALRFDNQELREFRSELYRRLASRPLEMIDLAKAVGSLADKVGKDAPANLKRARIQIILQFAAQFYRQVLLQLQGIRDCEDPVLRQATQKIGPQFPGGAGGALQAWKRCLTAMEHVDRNANQSALLECWAAEIASASAS